MDDRFYFESVNNNKVVFSAGESQHIVKVRRKQVGDEILSFNGDGLDYKLKIEEIGKQVRANVISKTKNRAFGEKKIVVYLAMLKNEALQTAIDNLAELNVSEVKLFKADFSIANLDNKKLEKLNLQSIQASKQCERADVMRISIIDKNEIKKDLQNFVGDFTLIIGPEGGFSPEEVKYFSSFSTEISLGKTILRAEVAVVSAVSALKAVSL